MVGAVGVLTFTGATGKGKVCAETAFVIMAAAAAAADNLM
jgi:hypothetical protein